MNPADTHSCSYQCERPICIRRQRDELYTAILLQEPGFTAADMADQYATAFERGRESVLAEQAAAAQGAVAWTVVGPDGKSSIGGWHVMETHDFWKEAGVLREGHRYAYAYAAPVAAAPVDLYRQLFEAAMNTAHAAMEYVQRNQEKFNAKAGDDKLEIICREFLRAQVSAPAALGIDLRNLLAEMVKLHDERRVVLTAHMETLKELLIDASPKAGDAEVQP